MSSLDQKLALQGLISPSPLVPAPVPAPIQLAPLHSRPLRYHFRTLYLLSATDHLTFILPNSLFALLTALSPQLHPRPIPLRTLLFRFPLVPFFNLLNLLIFNLANQRHPSSVAEDTLNKPHRPIPSGRLSASQAQRLLLYGIPLVVGSSAAMGAASESVALLGLTWMYNDLGGGNEEGWVVRNAIIAVAFAVYHIGGIKTLHAGVSEGIADGGWGGSWMGAGSWNWGLFADTGLSREGSLWLGVISMVVWTTMHVQDLCDIEGDRARGRDSAPLVLGEDTARWSVAVPVVGWSVACVLGLGSRIEVTAIVLLLGSYVAGRAVILKGKSNDKKTWMWWAFWLIGLYVLPLEALMKK